MAHLATSASAISARSRSFPAYPVSVKNLTLSVDERTLDRARDAARKRGKSLNTLVREFLDELAGTRLRPGAVEQLQRLWAQKAGRSGGRKLTGDGAYEGRA